MTVQSALGEPLRAEIDVPDINAEEAGSLKANVAKPAAFVAAGLEYNAAMSSLQTTLERRADGRAFIRLSSHSPINDPFVDIILEATWSSGRIVRDYTMLFDPPVLRQPSSTPTLSQLAPAAAKAPTPAPATTPAPAPEPTSASAPAPAKEPEMAPASIAAATPAPADATSPPVPDNKPASEAPVAADPPKPAVAKGTQTKASLKPAVAAADDGAKQVTVKTGDTASKIVGGLKSTEVSLDQMLVALLRSNPDAFVNGNINRIRTGTVVSLPNAETALALSPTEATQIVVAQSKDFNEFRRNLATNAPNADVPTASRTASGTVQAKVDDKKAPSVAPDKLTLSKGSKQNKADEAKIAKERAEKDAQERAAEITKNINDLKKQLAAPAPVVAPAPAPVAAPVVTPPVVAPAAPQVAVTPAVPVAALPPVAPVAPPVEPAPVVAPPPVNPAPAMPVAAPAASTELLDDIIKEVSENPVVQGGIAALLAVLGAALWLRTRQRKKKSAHVDSSFLESRLQPDSFFGASGGQRVDTSNENSVGGSSMVYSSSQLDAADDVDPVAEADVYLAYGRDLQAEEILKEAIRTSPGRLAIHTKLLEIFAKRRDTKSFETTAMQVHRIAGSSSAEWGRVCEMGVGIDPNNPLYQPGGNPAALPSQPADPVASYTQAAPRSTPAVAAPAGDGVDLDLDLDFSLDDEPASAISDVTGGQAAVRDNSLEMDFDLSSPMPFEASAAADPFALPEISLSMDGVSLTEKNERPAVSYASTNSMPIQANPPSKSDRDSGLMEFDLGALSLDLDASAPESAGGPSSENEDPLGTKLALAEEFVSIGDQDGARALIEEVVAESSGAMRAKAQRALASLS